jgi:hypothetical protein
VVEPGKKGGLCGPAETERPCAQQGLSDKRLKRLELSTFCMASLSSVGPSDAV